MIVKHEILILENSSLFSSGIKSLLEKEELEVIGEIRYWDGLFAVLKTVTPNIILVDLIHRTDSSFESLNKLRNEYPNIPVLPIISADCADCIKDFFKIGINGFVFGDTSLSELIMAIDRVANRKEYFPEGTLKVLKESMLSDLINIKPVRYQEALSSREIEVCRLLCNGLTCKEIGAHLNISPRTVESHKKNIHVKLQIKSTASLVKYAIQNQLV